MKIVKRILSTLGTQKLIIKWMSTLNKLECKFIHASIDEGAVRFNLEPEKYQHRLLTKIVLLQSQNLDTCSCQVLLALLAS